MRKPMTWILTLAALYGAICLVFFLAQNRLVYFPSDVIRLTPKDVGVAYEDVRIKTEDNVQICGWAAPGPPGSPWVLYCHGNGGNIAGRLSTVRIFHRMGLSVLMFDYRGYGASEGAPYEEGLYRDAEAMWRYLTETRKVAASDIVVWGESLGGGVATWLVERHPPRALVLQSTFTSVPDVGAPVYWWLPVRLLARNVFPSVERIGRLACPVLHMHAADDTLIPYAIGRRLYEAGVEPHVWIDIVGGHNGGLEAQTPETLTTIGRFMQTQAPRAAH